MDYLPRGGPPAEWLTSIEAGRADLAARRPGVPAEVIITRLSELEARLRAEAVVQLRLDSPHPRV